MLLLFEIKIHTKMSGRHKRGRSAAHADEDDVVDQSVGHRKGKTVAKKKGKADTAGAETAAETAAAEVESLAAEAASAAAAKTKQPPPPPSPSKPAHAQ